MPEVPGITVSQPNLGYRLGWRVCTRLQGPSPSHPLNGSWKKLLSILKHKHPREASCQATTSLRCRLSDRQHEMNLRIVTGDWCWRYVDKIPAALNPAMSQQTPEHIRTPQKDPRTAVRRLARAVLIKIVFIKTAFCENPHVLPPLLSLSPSYELSEPYASTCVPQLRNSFLKVLCHRS